MHNIKNFVWYEDIKYFKKEEFNHPDMVSYNLLHRLDQFREFVGKPIIIHSDFRSGDKGQHGKGLAVDIHIKDMHVIDQFLCAEKSGLFTGIGVYPNWFNPGLHLDIRSGNNARWGCWTAPIYVPLDMPFFRRIIEKEIENV